MLPTRLAPEVGYFCSAVFNANTKECVWRAVFSQHLHPATHSDQREEDHREEPMNSILKFKTQTPKVTGLLSAPNIPTSHLVVALAHRYFIFYCSPFAFKGLKLTSSLTSPSRCKMKAQGSSFSSVLFIVSFKHNLWNIYYVPHSLPSIRNTIVN